MATQVSLNSGAVASAGALALQTNGTTEAVSISTGQVATLAQNPILTSGTANGVAYLNGSKVLTTGSALVFDGTNLGVGVTPSAWQSGFKAIQLSGLASWNVDGSTAGSATYFGNNVYRDSTNTRWQYLVTGDNATQYLQASGQHIWRTAPSGTAGNAITFTQAMTLDASGNLGIGTSSPATKFHVSGSGSVIGQIETSGTQYAILRLKNSVHNSDVGADSTSLYMDSGGAYPIVFYTGATSTERARIDSSGNLLVGTTSNPNDCKIAIGPTASNGISIESNSTSVVMSQLLFRNPNGIVGSVSTAGSTTTYATSSDYRLKENIAPMTGALEKVVQLKPCTYTWKTDGSEGQGFIAHELQAVVPDAVVGAKDAVDEDGNAKYQGIDTSFLVATLTAAIQELKAEFDAYKASHP